MITTVSYTSIGSSTNHLIGIPSDDLIKCTINTSNKYTVHPYMLSISEINNSALKTKLLSDFVEALAIMDDDSIMADEIEQTIHMWATLNKVS